MREWEQIAESLFGEALSLPVEARPGFLERTCGGTTQVRRRVEELLAEHERLSGFLDAPAARAFGARTASGADEGQTAAGAHEDQTAVPPSMRMGRYVIVAALGAGGMGTVYRARDEKLGREVALKIMNPGAVAGEEQRRRFQRESLVLAKLNHNRIAAVYDVGEQDGADFIVMECVQGESLRARLRSGPLGLEEATTILLQITEALEEAHEHGVVHRDLKPANVMLTPKGQVKVLDFGIAKLLALQGGDETLSGMQTQGLIGTPAYMSPEQVMQEPVDARTDLWSLGVLYYETLTGRIPFQAEGAQGMLRAITDAQSTPVRSVRPEIPALAEQIIGRALEKDVRKRYQTASEMAQDAAKLLEQLDTPAATALASARRRRRVVAITASVAVLVAIVLLVSTYRRITHQRWAREEAGPQIAELMKANRSIDAYHVLQRAQRYLPEDEGLKQIAAETTMKVSVSSSPAGATVQIQDYDTPNAPWFPLGVTPLSGVTMPKGYFRWKVAKAGLGEMITAPETGAEMSFPLDQFKKSPEGMVYDPGGFWADNVGFVGWLGNYTLPPFFVSRYEVTNEQYQRFVDSGGYEKPAYWREPFVQNGHTLPWSEAIAQFRDTTDRPGPSTWAGGHYPEGKAEYPVSGVSWYEASAYAAFTGQQLPVMAQWYQAAPPELGSYVVAQANMSSASVAPVGANRAVGPYGTFDMGGNVREWVRNPLVSNLRYILGGSWKSQTYMYYVPEAASPFDRGETNGFRCVRTLAPLPAAATDVIKPIDRDFSKFKPASDAVFHAYELLYEYPNAPLHAKVEGTVRETVDWREEKVSYDTGYRGERMSAFLFLPKNVKPPYQTVLFFPSARVEFLDDDGDNGRHLEDTKFFDYVVQSGRAVLYPIYENTYDRRVHFFVPSGSQSIEITTDWYKDAARSLDYLDTRPDIDRTKLAYLGVSMGSASGVILSTLLQDRLKTAVFLDGGYFLDPPPPGGDQAEFAVRMKKPVLMVNGKYDYTFAVDRAQEPLFAMLGTPKEDKRHVLLDTPHDVAEQRPQLVKTVLEWLDHYMGRVGESPTP